MDGLVAGIHLIVDCGFCAKNERGAKKKKKGMIIKESALF